MKGKNVKKKPKEKVKEVEVKMEKMASKVMPGHSCGAKMMKKK